MTSDLKDYGFTIGQMSDDGSVEIGTDGSTPDTWWYRVETKTLQRFLQMASVLAEEAKLRFTETGFYTNVVDASHVSMLTIATPGSALSGTDVVVEVDIELKDLSRCIDKDEDHITLVCGKNQSHLHVQNDNCVTKLRLLDRQSPMPRVPTFDTFDASATISCAALTKAVRRMSDIADIASLRSDGDKVSFVTESGNTERTYTLPTDSVEGEASAQTYSLYYLKPFCAALPKAKRDQFDMRIGWSDSKPLLIHDNEGDTVDWTWILAPRTEGDA